jgi:hypothetical protein
MAQVHSHAGLEYTTICREWRCKFSAWPSSKDVDVTSRIVQDCVDAYDSIKDELKATKGVVVVRQLMCSTCCDFKIQITMDADGEQKNMFEPCGPPNRSCSQFMGSGRRTCTHQKRLFWRNYGGLRGLTRLRRNCIQSKTCDPLQLQ